MFSLIKFYLSTHENIRNKSYEIVTHSAVKPKMTNYKYMQSMNYRCILCRNNVEITDIFVINMRSFSTLLGEREELF